MYRFNEATVKYIIDFLCNFSSGASEVGYCREDDVDPSKKVVIMRSDFFNEDIFGTARSLPLLPLRTVDGIPLLFGENRVETRSGQTVIYADLVASSFFLMSRYEETVNNERDHYGRFLAKFSVAGKEGFIDRPVVDEYGRYLRKLMHAAGLDIGEPPSGFGRIYLTHDIDTPWKTLSFIGMIKKLLLILIREHRIDFYPVKVFSGHPECDCDNYYFPQMLEMDKTVSGAESIYFVLAGGEHAPVDPPEYIETEAFRHLLTDLIASGAEIGYHVSYEAALNTHLTESEMKKLKAVSGRPVSCSRNHYLASLHPKDFYSLIEQGITDDYTMGFADCAGFRLSTSRAVRWIDPSSFELTDLKLHPLIVMDCSLYEKKYMGLDFKASLEYVRKLLLRTASFHGDWCILWHNGSYKCDEKAPVNKGLLIREIMRVTSDIAAHPVEDNI